MNLLRIQKLETITDLRRSLENGLVALIHTDDQGNVTHSILTAHEGLAEHLLGEANPLNGVAVEAPGIAAVALPYDGNGAQIIDPETLTGECVCVASAQNPRTYYPSIGEEQADLPTRRGTTQFGHPLGPGLKVHCASNTSGTVNLEYEADNGLLFRHRDIESSDPSLDHIQWDSSTHFLSTPGYLVLSAEEGAAFSAQSFKGSNFVFDMQIPAIEVVDQDTGETSIFVTK